MVEQLNFKAKIKNSIHGNGMIQCQELKPIIGKNATVTITINPDEGVEITETKKELI